MFSRRPFRAMWGTHFPPSTAGTIPWQTGTRIFNRCGDTGILILEDSSRVGILAHSSFSGTQVLYMQLEQIPLSLS